MELNACFLPSLADPKHLAGATVVVVDILRATTTILHALGSGAVTVIPCREVDDVWRLVSKPPKDTVLGGERGGVRIPGFDLGNSPAEYTPQVVAGKTVVITTTNGTAALDVCRAASRVLFGAFVNISALVAELVRTDRVAFVCAGTNGRVTREDVLFTGAAIAEVLRSAPVPLVMNDEAALAIAAWHSSVGSLSARQRLITAMQESHGGRNLVALGFGDDIRLAAEIDAMPWIAELVMKEWHIIGRARVGS